MDNFSRKFNGMTSVGDTHFAIGTVKWPLLMDGVGSNGA
jgi:hypothetical protein